MCSLMYKLLMLLKTESDYRSKNLLPASTSGNLNTRGEKDNHIWTYLDVIHIWKYKCIMLKFSFIWENVEFICEADITQCFMLQLS